MSFTGAKNVSFEKKKVAVQPVEIICFYTSFRIVFKAMEKEYSEHFGQVIMVQGKCPAKHDFF